MSSMSHRPTPRAPARRRRRRTSRPGSPRPSPAGTSQANGLRQHAVIGGDGPPLLLVHGWPETWYAWRLLMPALAENYTVIAVDQRGIGLTDKPADGYDAGTLASDLVALMDALGHERFAVVGHDTGLVISYALAADHPDRVDRAGRRRDPRTARCAALAAAVRPRRRSTTGSGTSPSTGSDEVAEQLVQGREDIFFGYEFAIQGGHLPDERGRLLRRARLRPRRAARQLRRSTGPGTRPWRRTTSARPAVADAGAGDRRRDSWRPRRRRRHAARRGRRAERRHPRRRPLGRRGGTRGDAGRADRVPRPLPRRRGRCRSVAG